MAEIYVYSKRVSDAAKLIGMTCAHPMFTHEHAYETDRVIALLRNEMSVSELHSTLDSGKKLAADKVCSSILTTGDER